MLNMLKGFLLGVADEINERWKPFKKFERAPCLIDAKPLPEKAEFYWGDIQDNWLHGPYKEFYWSMKPNDMGDMAIWQGLYTFTCAVKDDIPATLSAVKGQSLIQTLGGDNRLARGVDAIGGPHNTDPTRTYFEDRGYVYLQDVSESTLIGHMFGLWSILYFGQERVLKGIAGQLLEDLAKQVIADGYILKDHAGKPARFGDLRPSLTTAPIRIASLACLLLLSSRTSESKEHKDLYDQIVRKYKSSILHPETHVLWVHPQYQDILAYFVLAMLATAEQDEKLKQEYKDALWQQWEKNCEEGNSFYTFIVQFVCGGVDQIHLQKAAQVLQEFNTDPKKGPTAKQKGSAPDNSDIKSVVWGWKQLKGGDRVALEPVPVWRRPPMDIAWQRSPYSIQGSSDCDYNGLDFLSAYYLGVYLGIIK